MDGRARETLEARLSALDQRVSRALEQARAWLPPFATELGPLEAELARAEASASLQAQRCAALEDRVTELEAALVGARDQRDRALAELDSSRSQTSRALDELDAERSRASTHVSPDPSLNAALQAKLLDIERLRSERDGLRRSLDEWRRQAQKFRRERDEASASLERIEAEHQRLAERDQLNSQRLAELERETHEQARALELAKRRAQHLREHIVAR